MINLETAQQFRVSAYDFERELHRLMEQANSLHAAAQSTAGAGTFERAMLKLVQDLEDVNGQASAAAEELEEMIRGPKDAGKEITPQLLEGRDDFEEPDGFDLAALLVAVEGENALEEDERARAQAAAGWLITRHPLFPERLRRLEEQARKDPHAGRHDGSISPDSLLKAYRETVPPPDHMVPKHGESE